MTVESSWKFLETDPVTHKTLYFRTVGDKIQIRETIPMWLATAMIEDNKRKAADFHDNGGWKGAKKGAVVAAVPHHIDQHLKAMSGFDPSKGGEYDRVKYNSFLDDIDYAKLRTGGGKIGKRKAFV